MLIATDIFDFNSWYRFNQKSFSEDLILDLETISEIPGNILLNKIGIFEEDSDKFFVCFNTEGLKKTQTSNLYTVSIDSVESIIPFNDNAKIILSNKLLNFRIENPIDDTIADKIFRERNQYLAKLGGEMALSVFKIEDSFQHYEVPFLVGLHKYNNEIKSDSLIETLIYYERSRPYPNDDSGFLFDVGSIAKTHFNISDKDLKFREKIKTEDVDKYELIEEILSLSVFLQNFESEGVFGALIDEMKKSKSLKKLDSDLSLIPENAGLNNILLIALYLKFRYLIRNTANLVDANFQKQIKNILKHAEKEASIALFLNGLFFGSLKFRELYYELYPLPFSKEKVITSSIKEHESALNRKETEEAESIEKPMRKTEAPSDFDNKIQLILNCFEEKNEIDLQELKDEIKEKTGDTLGRGFKQLKQVLEKISGIVIDEKSSPQIAILKKQEQGSSPDLFTQQK